MLRIQDAILYGSKKGGGGVSPSGSIEISENGTYDVTDKAEAVVDVEPNLTTKQITQNGTYPASGDNADGYSSVSVAVPGPSGKITISQNGTDIDVSSYALADVNVSGGASNEDAILEGTFSGAYVNNRITTIKNNIFEFSTIQSINSTSVSSIGRACFKNCKSLTSVNLTNLSSTDSEVFSNCIALISVNLPELSRIGDMAFQGCTSLQSIDLPKVYSLKSQVFIGCTNLATIDLHDIGEFSGSGVFINCSNLTAVIIRRNTFLRMPYGGTFNNTPIASGTGYIYVPAALVDSYKAATNWATYAAQFRALEDYTVDGTTTGDLDPTKI